MLHLRRSKIAYMIKLILIVSFSVFLFSGYSQTNNSADTIYKHPDSTIIDEIKDNVLDNIPTISLDDNDLSDASSQAVSSVLTAGRDPFYSAAAFNFSPARFRIRGYDGDYGSTYMNGIPMDNLDNGFTPFGLWGGLNDVTRNKDVSIGLRYNTYAFGDIGTTTSIDSRASRQRKQTSLSYGYSNRTYDQRLMFTHSTGLNKNGWAFTVSGSRRYADEGYVAGTYYNGWSYFGAVDKKIGQRQILSLTVFGAPTENGRQGAATTEIMDLAGSHYYNPYWGYQNGKKRNANIGKTNQPVAILTHDFRITNNTNLTTSLGYSSGERSVSGLDWYNAPDPRPDYYRYLPSYYAGDPEAEQQVYDQLKNSEAARQINWQNLYDVNRASSATIYNVEGIAGNNVSGKRSYYIQQERVTNARRMNFNTVVNTRLNNHIDLSAGLSFQSLKNNYFERVADLLGGEFYVDLNQFAERDFPSDPNANQNDVNHPNRILNVGDKYGYDYDININKPAGWLQLVFKYKKVDFFAAGEASQTQFYRVGHVKNGLFLDNSFGKSSLNTFNNYAAKGGITYKLNGRNYFYVNGAVLTKAPYYDNAYISPRTRDFLQDGLTSELIQTAEAGYILNAPKLKIKLNGYYTRMQHGFNVLSFYNELYQTFVNYAIKDIDRVYFGGEFGFEAKLMPNVTLTGAAAVGRYYYDSRQQATTTLDNSTAVQKSETVYAENYRIPGTPQEAYSMGISYRSPKFWFVSVSGNYFDQMWLDFNPIRRTYSAVEDLSKDDPIRASILAQTQLAAQYTIDAFAGYSIKLKTTVGKEKKPLFLVFNGGVNNILNNKDIVTGGYEQLRFDYTDRNVDKFPSKYYYAFGLNYFFSATIRF